MSLSAKRMGLILVSALFFIISCKEKETVGLDPGQILGVSYTDTFSISTKAYLKGDSIITSSGNYLFTGAYADPEFGNIKAEAYTQLLQAAEGTPVTFTSVDSVVVKLAYDYQYGDTLQSQTINVYKLTENLSAGTVYYADDDPLNKEASPIDNDAAFTLKPSTGIQKLYLNNTFGSDILTTIGGGISNSSFVSFLPGVALIPKNDNVGAIIRYKVYDNSSRVTIYYKNGAAADSVLLYMNTSGARFSRLVADRSGTPALSGLINAEDEVDVSGKVYLQSGLGVKTKLFFPGLNNIKETFGQVVVNRAELVVETDPAVTPDQLTEISLLHLIKLDGNGNPNKVVNPSGVIVDDEVQKEYQPVNGTLYPLEVTYNTTTNSYSFNISTLVHAILIGAVENNGLLVTSHPIVNSTSVNRSVGGLGASTVKLKLYFTKVE